MLTGEDRQMSHKNAVNSNSNFVEAVILNFICLVRSVKLRNNKIKSIEIFSRSAVSLPKSKETYPHTQFGHPFNLQMSSNYNIFRKCSFRRCYSLFDRLKNIPNLHEASGEKDGNNSMLGWSLFLSLAHHYLVYIQSKTSKAY